MARPCLGEYSALYALLTLQCRQELYRAVHCPDNSDGVCESVKPVLSYPDEPVRLHQYNPVLFQSRLSFYRKF